MSNTNTARCRLRQHANELKREIAAQRTAQIQARIDDILNDREKMAFLAHLYVFWEKEFTDAPGANYEQQRIHRAMLSLDAAMSLFCREHYFLTNDTGEYIKNAEAPFDLPTGWQYDLTDAQWANYSTLPHKTWKYVFFYDQKPLAAFESVTHAQAFFRSIEAQHKDVASVTNIHLSRTEQREAKGKRYLAIKRGFHWTVVKVHENGKLAHSAQVMPPLTPHTCEDKIAKDTAAFLNDRIAEATAARKQTER